MNTTHRILFGLLGILLTGGTPLAASWYAGTFATGNESDISSFAVGTNFFAYFARQNSTDLGQPWGNGDLFEGTYNNGWHYTPVYSSASAGAVSVSSGYIAFYRYVAHADADGKLRLSIHSPFSDAWSTQLVDNLVTFCCDPSIDPTTPGLPVKIGTVVFGGKLYIFYIAAGAPVNHLSCAIWDGAKFTYQVLDGNGNMTDPAPVVAPDGIRVYYTDYEGDILREAHSKDGVVWFLSTIDGGCCGVHPSVGRRPSAIVHNGNVHVFYYGVPSGPRWLYTAGLYGGVWSFGVVETGIDGAGDVAAAPLVHANTIHVFYLVGPNLYDSYSTGPGTFQTVVLDGFLGSSVGACCRLIPPLSAVEVNNSQPLAIYGALLDPYQSVYAVRSLTWLP